MVTCYLCKGKIRVTRDKHLFDEKLKKRYHLKCYAGICRVCDKPVYSKSKHKVIGSNVWHAECYKRAHRHNPRQRTLKTPPPPPRERKLKLPPPPPILRKLKHKNPHGLQTEEMRELIAEMEDAISKTEGAVKQRLTETLGMLRENPSTSMMKIRGSQRFLKVKTEHPEWPETDVLREYIHQLGAPKKNPRRPTKEFWDKHYPEVLAQYKKKYPKKEAEERARKATAAIWYDTMGPKKKASYEAIRRKREARENPPKDIERFEKELLEALDTTFLVYETKNLPATKSVTLMSMRPTPVDRGTYSVVDTPEHRRLLEDLDIKYKELKVSAEHAKLLVKQMLKRDRQNPTLVTPEQETDIVGAFQRVIHGMGTEADKLMVRMAREADVIMSTGPSVMVKRNPEEPLYNPKDTKVDYIIQDEFGTVFETGKGTEQEAESRALHYNKKYMREFKVIYPKGESPEVKKAAQTATREMLKD